MNRSTAARTLAALLCLALLLSACAPSLEEDAAPAMGRYVEEVLPLPAELVSLWWLGPTPQGDLLLLGRDEASPDIGAWRSADGGESWQREQPDWLETLNRYRIDCLTVDGEGAVWFTHEAEDPERDAIDAGGDPEAIDASIPPPNPLVALRGATAEETPAAPQNEHGNQAQELQIHGGLAAVSYGGLAVYETDSGLRRFEVLPDRYFNTGEFLLDGEHLAAVDGAVLRLYALGDGRPLAELPLETATHSEYKADFFDFQSSDTVVAATGENAVYAYCNSSGIYRLSADGLIHERVLDGALSSLVQPTTSIRQLFVQGEEYFVYITDRESVPWSLSGAALLRYSFQEDVPALPSVELRVRALSDSPTARQAAANFQREHPEVRVRFEAMLDGSDAMTAEDALHLLSVELLSGQGPDVLILDGMPVDSYREKGALLDLDGLLPQPLCDDMLPNLLAACRSNGGLWAVPTRFTAPMLLAAPEDPAALDSLSALSARIATLDSPQLGILPGELFDLLYLLFADGWFGPDGALDEAALAQGLEEIASILSRYDGVDPDRLWNSEGDARVGALGWIDGWAPFHLGELAAVDHLAGPYTAVTGYGAVYTPYPVGGARLFPHSVAGVSAGSAQPELAAAFIACMLSEPVQSLKLGDGLPVNRTALAVAQANAPFGGKSRYGVSFEDDFSGGAPRGLTLPLIWPDDAFFAALWEQLEALEAAPLPDASVLQIVRQETQPYFAGARPLEATVQSLKAKLDLYLEER